MWNVDLPKNQEGGLALFPPRSSKVLLGPPRSSCSWVREGIGLPLVPPGPPRPPPSGAPGLPSHGTAACRRPGPGATIHKKCGHHSTDSPPPPPQHQAREAPHTRPLFLLPPPSDFCNVRTFYKTHMFTPCPLLERQFQFTPDPIPVISLWKQPSSS